MAHYLVTGGAGFIGSHLVEALKEQGHSIVVLDNLSTGNSRNLPVGIKMFIGDVANKNDIAHVMDRVEGIFHLAAVASVKKSLEMPVETHRTNLTGTVAILDAARAANIPVVYASSAAVYGDVPEVPLKETSATKPLSTYAADKLGSEQHAAVARHVFNIPTLGLRFFNVYGVRQDPKSPYSGVVSLFARQLETKEPIAVHGDGDQTRDFVFVGDVVQALTNGMQLLHEKGVAAPALMNICTGVETSVLQLAKTMMQVWGNEVPLTNEARRAGDIVRSFGENHIAQEALNISNWTTLAEGLKTLLKPREE